MRGGGWCAWLLPDKAAWGLQGLHLAMSTAVVPGGPGRAAEMMGTVLFSAWPAGSTGNREGGCKPEDEPLTA